MQEGVLVELQWMKEKRIFFILLQSHSFFKFLQIQMADLTPTFVTVTFIEDACSAVVTLRDILLKDNTPVQKEGGVGLLARAWRVLACGFQEG